MKFKYIEKTPQPPKESVIFGHKFVLNGDPVEVKNEFVISRLKGMAHIGFIPAEEGEEGGEVEAKKVPNLDESSWGELRKFATANNITTKDLKKETLVEAINDFLNNGSNESTNKE